MNHPNHDWLDFMTAMTREMADEYKRIQKRATEDPGTAGDQGEENWAKLLRSFLPPAYQVVTKGRILGHEGTASPQVDVLVLSPSYPSFLLDKKVYLAGGVSAAFECKNTLKTEHIKKAVQTCAEIKRLVPVRFGSPFKELFTPLRFGLLAHSHVWKRPNSSSANNIQGELFSAQRIPTHPRESLDLLCVADLATWLLKIGRGGFLNAQIDCNYISYERLHLASPSQHTPIGSMLTYLLTSLAWEEPALRGWAEHLTMIGGPRSGAGFGHVWTVNIYSKEVEETLAAESISTTGAWNEWGEEFPLG